MWIGSIQQTLPANELSVTMYSGWTSTNLYLGFQVTDPPIPGQTIDPSLPYLNNAVELFIGGTPNSPDFTGSHRNGSRQAFQIISDEYGNKLTVASAPGNGFTNSDWSVATSTNATGYVVEFGIPLSLIQTPTGNAGLGSSLMFNVGIDDNNTTTPFQENQGVLWLPSNGNSPFGAGETSWVAALNLVPEPSSCILLGIGCMVAVAGSRRINSASGKSRPKV
jgi:hypothetical protein